MAFIFCTISPPIFEFKHAQNKKEEKIKTKEVEKKIAEKKEENKRNEGKSQLNNK